MKSLKSFAVPALLAGALCVAAVGCKTHDSEMSASGGSYPLTKCVVSGEDLGDKPYVFVHNGQQVKLCCKDCLAKFNRDPETYVAKINQAK
jgi:hypothetical protein